jgi:methionyl-tRNA formyltransferase
MKIVFMGTPEFAAGSLKALIDWAQADDSEIAAVYCQPDRPAGRGHKCQAGPAKALALEHNIPVLQPKTLKDELAVKELAAFKADVFAVAAYGLIIPQKVLDLPPLGAVNGHGSLLPEWRGAAPIQRAVMNGDIRTGVTIQKVVFKLDSGPIILQRAVGIGDNQTSGELHDELARLGGRLLTEALERLRDGRAMLMPQDESRVTYAAKLEKADGILDFSQRALDVHNRARGVTPWPGAQIFLTRRDSSCSPLPELKVIVEKGRVIPGEAPAGSAPGTLLPLTDGLIPIACASGLYGLERVKPSSGKPMDAAAFSNGYLKNNTGKASPKGLT